MPNATSSQQFKQVFVADTNESELFRFASFRALLCWIAAKKDVSPESFLKCLERGCSIALVVNSPNSAFLALPEIEHGV